VKAPARALARLSVAGCAPFPALVSEEQAWALDSLHALRGGASMDALLAHWAHDEAVLASLPGTLPLGAPLAAFTVHEPLTPGTVYCTIGNYRDQLLQAALDANPSTDPATLTQALAHRQREGAPYIAIKPTSAVASALAPLVLPIGVGTLDWEVELGVVIGLPARHVPAEHALQHVAGYCTVNDITLRERLFRADPPAMGTDFLQAKGGPGWLPVGPWLVPARNVANPAALRLTLTLNGRVMQDGLASDMLFSIAEQIAYLSRHAQLLPGDLICTGSPAGFGSHHGRYLRPGDLVEAEVHGLGRQRTLVTTSP
jgi:2,4-diketo-3-deoxy-L-fuconate hydrolase